MVGSGGLCQAYGGSGGWDSVRGARGRVRWGGRGRGAGRGRGWERCARGWDKDFIS